MFQNIAIQNIWMNTAMDPDHPQAELTHQLHSLATTAMRNFARLNVAMSPELRDLVALYGLDNDDAMKALREDLPTANGIQPKYVHAGMTPSDLDLPLHNCTIRVIGPEKDIDHFYLVTEYSLTQLLELGGFRQVRPFALKLYVFWKNPLNYVGLAVTTVLELSMRVIFMLYGKKVRVLSKKVAAVAVR